MSRAASVERALLRRSLPDFFRAAWHVLEASTPLQWGPHLDALCAHLQAQLEGWARRQADPTYEQPIKNLLATLPPGTLKSKALVFASAWAWLRWPSLQILALSGNPRIAIRDSMLVRQLVTSNWYRETFRPSWQIRDDQDSKSALGNTAGGVRLAMGWDARAVGEHVSWIQTDDPHDPEQVESDAQRASVIDRWDTSWANRVNDLASSIRTGIAQRTHEDDWSARRIAEGWTHLDLPMLFEPERACTTPLGEPDWRTVENECLLPSRFPPTVIAAERARVGERRWATLYQGRPAPAGGSLVRLAWLRFWRRGDQADAASARPRGCWLGPSAILPTTFDSVTIAADLAGGKKTIKGDYNVIVAVGRKGSAFYLLDVWRDRADFPDVQRRYRAFAARWPSARKVVEQAASGAALVASLQSEIPGLIGVPTGGSDKVARLESVLALFEAGNVHFDEHATSLDALITELTTFPNATHDDFVDALTLALSQAQATDDGRAAIRRHLAWSELTPTQIDAAVDRITEASAASRARREQQLADQRRDVEDARRLRAAIFGDDSAV